MPDEARGGFIGAVGAEKRQIDERRDSQPHVVEPDEHAQPVVGQQAEEYRQAELPESGWALADVGPDRDNRSDSAVLVVPSRVRRLAQERIDDRRHPKTPAQHAHRLFDERLDAIRADKVLDRPQASLQGRVEQDVIDRE